MNHVIGFDSWNDIVLKTFKGDCEFSSSRDCRQIHAIIKQSRENDVENRNLQFLATSGYFVHDFEELNISKN